MQLLQLLNFELLFPQKAGVAIILDGKILLLVGRGQRLGVWGILEGLEEVRIRILLLVVLGEEGGDKLLLAELVRLHGWGPEGEGGRAGWLDVGGKREPGREGD